uniref:Uncharacterized protein n=1 Tax=Anguilla anguilla TaxID=7936 RepID=A0A0E9RZ10_ANGAN
MTSIDHCSCKLDLVSFDIEFGYKFTISFSGFNNSPSSQHH